MFIIFRFILNYLHGELDIHTVILSHTICIDCIDYNLFEISSTYHNIRILLIEK